MASDPCDGGIGRGFRGEGPPLDVVRGVSDVVSCS